MTGVAIHILRRVGTVAIILTGVLILSFLVVSQIMGWQISPVYGGGMSPTFTPGDAIIIESMDAGDIEVDDIMSYHSPLDGKITTHRVVEVVDEEGEALFFRTRGDGNENDDPYIVPAENVTGRAKYHLPLLGYFSYFARTPLGVGLMIGLPGLVVTTAEVNNLIWTLIPQERRKKRARWATGMKKKDWVR